MSVFMDNSISDTAFSGLVLQHHGTSCYIYIDGVFRNCGNRRRCRARNMMR